MPIEAVQYDDVFSLAPVLDYFDIPVDVNGYRILGSNAVKQRASAWGPFRNEELKGKVCLACGRKSNLNLHHILPFYLFPELELVRENTMPLCEGGPTNCHYLFGHGGLSWTNYMKKEHIEQAIGQYTRLLNFLKHRRKGTIKNGN